MLDVHPTKGPVPVRHLRLDMSPMPTWHKGFLSVGKHFNCERMAYLWKGLAEKNQWFLQEAIRRGNWGQLPGINLHCRVVHASRNLYASSTLSELCSVLITCRSIITKQTKTGPESYDGNSCLIACYQGPWVPLWPQPLRASDSD